jgi:hypothetical protein
MLYLIESSLTNYAHDFELNFDTVTNNQQLILFTYFPRFE